MSLARASRGERALLVLLAVWGLAPIIVIALHALSVGDRLTGADGVIGGDQLQYLAWARDAGAHGLASNLFDLSGSGHVFVQPMFTLTGLLWRLGLPLQLAYLLWKPVAILVLFGGAAAWSARLFSGEPLARMAAVAIGVFFFTPLAALAGWASLGSGGTRGGLLRLAGELCPAGELWGYLPSAIAVGLMPISLLALERARGAGPRRNQALALAGVTALLASWLHPWQGAIIVVLLAGLAVWERGRGLFTLAVPAAGALLPLVYYLLLSKLDAAWKLASTNELAPHLPALVLLAGLLPPVLLAAYGLRVPGPDLIERALVLWIPASLAIYFAVSSYPSHALEGISLPLGVLMVRGWGRVTRGFAGRARGVAVALGVALLALSTLPGLAYDARSFRDVASGPLQQYYLSSSDAHALDWIREHAPPGGVMARTIFAIGVPSQTGRHVWVGQQFWSRDYVARNAAGDDLFGGQLPAGAARAVVAQSGVRIVVTDCGDHHGLRSTLAPISASIHTFGCATVYVVKRFPIATVPSP